MEGRSHLRQLSIVQELKLHSLRSAFPKEVELKTTIIKTLLQVGINPITILSKANLKLSQWDQNTEASLTAKIEIPVQVIIKRLEIHKC